MKNIEIGDLIDKEYFNEEETIQNKEVNSIISNLELYSDNIQMLTNKYTEIFEDENIVYIMTRISQNQIFMKHFPEFYKKNDNGESIINCQQNSPYHRYGVFKHILYTIEYVGKEDLKYSAHDMKILKWTMLLHDIGKPFVKTINSEGYDSFTGHDDMSVVIAAKILDRFDFNDEDKKIILTLIKYHDKYLNEGDLTYDNLSFLAKELDDKRDLFRLLIEVKIADNRAKSVDVYNKFMTVVGKYYDFENEYFSNEEFNKLYDYKNANDFNKEEIISRIDEDMKINERGTYKEGGSKEDLTEKIMSDITKDITNGKALKIYYQPIIDFKKQSVNGYEVFYKIVTNFDFSYKQILKKAREYGKYDKLQQMLFINALERFNDLMGKNELIQYINIDAKSYSNYVNKSRIFDMFEKNEIVLEFNNFETLLNTKIRDLSHEIFLHKGKVAIDNFESSNKVEKDIEQIEPKYIKYKLLNTEENTKEYLKQLVTYCDYNSINLIVFGIDTKELFKAANECKVRFVQGDYFSPPTDGLDMDQNIIMEKINNLEDLII